MDADLILLIGACVFMLCVMWYLLFIRPPKKRSFKASSKHSETESVKEDVDEESERIRICTDPIREKAKECESKLLPEQRNLLEILVEKEFPELPSVLRLEKLQISIKRDHRNKSMFDVHNVIYALNIARCGYPLSARVIPTRSEIEYILAHRDIINVYLEAFGLDQISENDEFWFLDVPENWTFNWADYRWDLSIAFDKLYKKFRVLTPDGVFEEPTKLDAKLILLLNGWEELFEKI